MKQVGPVVCRRVLFRREFQADPSRPFVYRVVRLKLQDGTAKHRDISTECKRELDADRGVAITAAYRQICWKGRWTQLLSGISGVGHHCRLVAHAPHDSVPRETAVSVLLAVCFDFRQAESPGLWV